MPSPQSAPTIRRRAVVSGAAWTVPLIAVAAAAPAVAASGATMGGGGKVSYVNSNSNKCTTYTISGSATFTNTTTSTSISNVVVTFWLPMSGLTFSVSSGTGWSAPAATGASQPFSNGTLYAYQTTYSGSTTASTGTTSWPFTFTSNCASPTLSSASQQFIASYSGVVDGANQSGNSALTPMTAGQ